MNKSVLIVTWNFYPKVGGAESLVFDQAKHLTKKGYRVAVVTASVEASPDLEELEGFEIVRRPWLSSVDDSPTQEVKSGFSALLEKYHPDIVHFHNGSYPSGAENKSFGVEKIKTIFETIRQASPAAFIIEHAHNAQLRDTQVTRPLRQLDWDYLICVSNFTRQEWEKLGTKAKKIKTIYNGIDLTKYSDLTPSPEIGEIRKQNPGASLIFFPARVVSMTTGNLSTQKNFTLLARAGNLLLQKGIAGFKLIIIFNEVSLGQSAQEGKKQLFRLLEENNLSKNTLFLPKIPPDQMPSYFAGIDIVCVPSLYETFGLVYLEGMAAAKFVIASNTGGPPEYIKNGVNGFLVDPENPADLAQVLEELIENADSRPEILENAQKTAQEFSVEKMMSGIEKVYHELIKSKKEEK
jgi:glycosyltransferase involved in cell wall biosynthesis